MRCVEVKGPGDSLSWAQKAWIDRLVAAGVRVQVARIQDTSSAEGGQQGRAQQDEAEDEEAAAAVDDDDADW